MNPALQYAEETLGVHSSYERALNAQHELDEITTELDKARDRKRELTEQVSEREMELLIQERGKHADMSQAGMDRHLAIVKAQDTLLVQLKQQLNGTAAQVDGLELDISIQQSIIKIETARMTELGGYFHFLAVCKQAELTTKTTKPGEQA